jgi:hypothetical protein
LHPVSVWTSWWSAHWVKMMIDWFACWIVTILFWKEFITTGAWLNVLVIIYLICFENTVVLFTCIFSIAITVVNNFNFTWYKIVYCGHFLQNKRIVLNCDDFVLKGVYHNGCMTKYMLKSSPKNEQKQDSDLSSNEIAFQNLMKNTKHIYPLSMYNYRTSIMFN